MAIIIGVFILGAISASAETEGIFTYTVSNGTATITDCDSTATGKIIIPSILGGYPVTEIGEEAFYKCDGLTSITIPESITKIGDSAFEDCNSLVRVDISDISAWCKIEFSGFMSNPLYYANNLYLNGSLVTNLIIPDSVTSISDYAFSYCSSLTNVTIPNSVTSFGDYAFYECNSLIRVDISDVSAWCKIEFSRYMSNPLNYANNLYLNESLVTNLIIPDSVISISDYAFYDCTGLTSVTIPNSVTVIGDYAFYNCTGLTSVIIPNSVTSLGEYAFSDCTGLTSATLSNNLTKIGDFSFSDCTSLTSIIIPDNLTTISDYAFRKCDNLTIVSVGSEIDLIQESAFSFCKDLKYVCLPQKIKYIKNDAFKSCSNIETVFYAGSESQWNEIMFYNGNENLTDANIVYNATKKTYKFATNCDAVLDDITDYAIFNMPTVVNGEKTFAGWYDNESLSGEPVTFPYYGDATTLYASWTDRTGKSFDDAFITKANQEYTVRTTENEQLVYFEFVPKVSKEYRFYTTGSSDTYGYLYNSNQSRLTYNNNSGEANNFFISYNLTAEETYYIAVKVYDGSGTFTFVVEEPVDYKINEITIKDMSGNSLYQIPQGKFLATVSFTNVSSSADTVIILAQYTESGAFKGLMYIQTEDVPTGSTIKLSIPVDNTSGDIAKLKAFCWASFSSMTPLGNAVSFPA